MLSLSVYLFLLLSSPMHPFNSKKHTICFSRQKHPESLDSLFGQSDKTWFYPPPTDVWKGQPTCGKHRYKHTARGSKFESSSTLWNKRLTSKNWLASKTPGWGKSSSFLSFCFVKLKAPLKIGLFFLGVSIPSYFTKNLPKKTNPNFSLKV